MRLDKSFNSKRCWQNKAIIFPVFRFQECLKNQSQQCKVKEIILIELFTLLFRKILTSVAWLFVVSLNVMRYGIISYTYH